LNPSLKGSACLSIPRIRRRLDWSAPSAPPISSAILMYPQLGAAGVPRNEIGEVAGTIAQAVEQSQVMDRPLTREEVVALLEAAY